ncbi:hypothetical protein C7B80_03120 [Cyanosarcina cf. burmensis CCALA 770]|nr:hypothetical protein C7B80_03120 [Cyanosarcina cf. burmensis CCALA 770]
MADLTLSFDPGASLTKVIYELGNEETIRLLLMEPEMIQLPQSSIESYLANRQGIGQARPENEAWVQCAGESECQVVGFLARQFLATPRLDRLKYESTLYKVLAAVGAIASSSDLPNRFSLALVTPLPYGEYRNHPQLKAHLQRALKDFRFRGQRFKVKLESFNCLPEGAGLALLQCQQNGVEWFQRQAIAVLMFGHRNTTALIFERGKMTAGHTTNLGFYQLVQQAIERTSGQEIVSLTAAIYEVGTELTPNNPILQSLVKSRNPDNQVVELKQLVEAIATARVEYWRRLEEWLDAVLPRTITQVVLSGGAAMYLYQELEDYFPSTPTNWGMDLQHQIQQILGLDYRSGQSGKESLSFRLVDGFGLFLKFRATHSAV